MVKYPNIGVNLIGVDGNAFSLIGSVSDALRRSGVARDIISEFRQEATSGDYDNVLATSDECGWCYEAHEDCECED